uniref:HutI_0 protein n=1 Tax=Fopius arisanus TaxID=64838 RepID=A0A0C9PK25_9HYME
MFLHFHGLGSLLVTLLVVSVQGAPTMTLEDRRLNSPEKWMNPCGEGLATEESDGEPEYGPLTDAELLNVVAVQARTALHQAQGFKDNYIKQTFNTDFAVLHSEWKDNHYDWLPGLDKIPKQLGEPLAPEYLSKLGLEMLDNILLDIYEYMQTYAVGLEQIVWDQEDHRLEFLQKFKDTESSLQTVLCELQAALIERGVTPRNNITRQVMPNDYRGGMSSQATFRNLRDWLIFRDYMNGLEYVIEVFGHLGRGVKS